MNYSHQQAPRQPHSMKTHSSTSQHPDHKAAQSLHLFVKINNGRCAGACYLLTAIGRLTRRALGLGGACQQKDVQAARDTNSAFLQHRGFIFYFQDGSRFPATACSRSVMACVFNWCNYHIQGRGKTSNRSSTVATQSPFSVT